MKKFFIINFFLIFFLINPLQANNIAFVNIDILMNTSIAGLDKDKKIKILQKQKNAMLKESEKKLKDKETDLVSKKNILSDSEFQLEIKKLKTEINNFNVLKNKEIKDFEKIKAQYNFTLLNAIKPILSDYTKLNNISLLFQKKNIILGSKEINITDDILKIMNDKIKEVNIKWQSH